MEFVRSQGPHRGRPGSHRVLRCGMIQYLCRKETTVAPSSVPTVRQRQQAVRVCAILPADPFAPSSLLWMTPYPFPFPFAIAFPFAFPFPIPFPLPFWLGLAAIIYRIDLVYRRRRGESLVNVGGILPSPERGRFREECKGVGRLRHKAPVTQPSLHDRQRVRLYAPSSTAGGCDKQLPPGRFHPITEGMGTD
jgi:hypothetical protein